RSTSHLLRPDVSRTDYLFPFCGVVGNELAEIGGRTRNRRAAELGKAGLKAGINEHGVDLAVELVNNLGRRVPWDTDALPRAGLIAGNELTQAGYFRQSTCTRCRCHGKRAQSSSFDVLDGFGKSTEIDLYLSTEQIAYRGRAAAIGHMKHLDSGHHVEQFA